MIFLGTSIILQVAIYQIVRVWSPKHSTCLIFRVNTERGEIVKHTQITCCYRCEDRHPNCHSECETYKKQKKDHEEYLMYVRDEKDVAAFIAECKSKGSKRKRKHRGDYA